MKKISLKKIATVQSGAGFPIKFQGKSDGDFPFAKVGEISRVARQGDLFINNASNWITESISFELKAKIFPKGTIVFAKIGEAIKQNFRAITDRPMLFDNNVMGITPNIAEVNIKYLFFFLKTVDFYQLASKTTLPSIRKSTIESLKIPLPPIAEQKRIAAILDKADAVRRKRREAIRLTEELLRSVFLDMFGDPVTNPMGWDVVSMSEVISNIQAGQSLKGEEREKKEGELGVLKVSAVTSGYFQENEYKVVDSFDIKKKVVIPKKGDLLFSRANTRELVAATCIVERDARDVFLPDKLWRIDVNENRATSEYLKFLLTDPEYRSLLTRKATGTSGSMLNISQTKLLEMNLPLPELNRQRKFSKFFWLITKGKSLITDTIQESEDLFNSLLQRAFTGNL